jgi:hypothetical protein
LLTEKQARQLGDLYHIHYSYFYKEAQQLDLLLTRNAIIDTLRLELGSMKEKSKKTAVPAA